jgi:polyisoprenoid-binding protein YceI
MRKVRFLQARAPLLLCLALSFSVVASPTHQETPQAVASEIVLTFDPAQSKIHWTVDSSLHTVHGTFDLDHGTLRLDPETGKAAGEIVVHVSTGQSGNDSRDARMHKEILQTSKYPEVVFRPTQLEGKLLTSGPSDGKLHGLFVIHGAEHDLAAEVHVELSGDRWKGTGKFEVPYVMWGIKDPSNFLLKVKHVVNVDLEMVGAVSGAK